MLVERGWSITAAGSTISIVLWLVGRSRVPLGGFLADRTKRPQSILAAGSIVFASLMLALPRSDAVVPIVIALGLVSGLPAGPIMSLPAARACSRRRARSAWAFSTPSIMPR